MIFAVNVVGNCATQCHIFCSRRHWEEEASRNGEVQDLRERNACFGGEQTSLRVEFNEAIHPRSQKKIAVLQQTNVAVASTHANRQCAVVDAGGDGREIALPVEWKDPCTIGWIAAPGFEGC